MIIFLIKTLQPNWKGNQSSSPFFVSIYGGDNNNVFNLIASVVLHTLQFTWNVVEMGFDLGYWVKFLSTTWFSMFLLTKYNDEYGFKTLE
jgi:hypothetical protein